MLPTHSLEHVFQDRLNDLFDITGVTYRQVVKGTHGSVKETYLWQLRSGRACNPSYKVITVLAQFFNVHPGYSFDGARERNNPDCDNLTLLVRELNETERRLVREVIRGILVQDHDISARESDGCSE